MNLDEITRAVTAQHSSATEDQVAQSIIQMGLTPDKVAPNMIGEIVGIIKNRLEVEGVGLAIKKSDSASVHKIDRKLQTGNSAPITRAERLELQRANQINLGAHVQAGSSSRNQAASAFIQNEVAKIDVAIDLAEAEQARDLVDRVIPAYAEWRIGQSPTRIANHIEAYGQEVAESLLPQFRSFSEVLSAELSEVADEVIRGFGAA